VCLITASKKGVKLDDLRFTNSDNHNPDGLGVMFVHDGRVQILKSLDDTDGKLALYKAIPDVPHVLHQRFATHGNTDLKMCHPFRVTDKDKHGLDIFVMHNGVMSDVKLHSKGKSDTWHFVKDYLRPVLAKDPYMLRNKGFKRMVAKLIGTNNKLAFLDSDGVMTIINRDAGKVIDDFWFSNTYSLSGTYRYSSPTNTNRWWEDDEHYYLSKSAAAHAAVRAAHVAAVATTCEVIEHKKPVLLPPPSPPKLEDIRETVQAGFQSGAPFDERPEDSRYSGGSGAMSSVFSNMATDRALDALYTFKEDDFEDPETRADYEILMSRLDPESLLGYVKDCPEIVSGYLTAKLGVTDAQS
jgi:predicted glutamine amidotransferase